MAPKKRRGSTPKAEPAQKKANSTPAPLTTIVPAPMPMDVVLGKEQAAHIVRVHESLQIITASPFFQGIAECPPLTVMEGGNQAPIVQSELTHALTNKPTSEVNAGGNFFWINHVWLANHRVPFNNTQLKNIAETNFPCLDPPACSPYRLHVAVDTADFKIMEHVGQLQRVSPEENDHFIIFQLANAIKQNASDDVLRRWRNMLLSIPFVFWLIEPGSDRYWKAQNLRELLVDHGDCAKRTTYQRVRDITGFKKDTEKAMNVVLSSSKIKEMFKRLKLARSSEVVTESFVDCAVTIDKRLLSIGECCDVLTWCDENLMGLPGTKTAHPFSSIYSLQAVIDRGQSQARIAFGFCGLVDALRMEYITPSEFAVKRLGDSKTSYMSVLNMKLCARDYLLGEYLDGLNIQPHCKSDIRRIFADFTSVRTFVTTYDGECDLSYQANWKKSALLVANLIEDMVYSTTFDGRYRDAIKSYLELGDFLQYASVAQQLTEINNAIKEENPSTPSPPIVQPIVAVEGDEGAGTVINLATNVTPVEKPDTGFDSLSKEDQTHWTQIMKK